MKTKEISTLLEFLSFPLYSSEKVFKKFLSLKGAKYYRNPDSKKEGFLYREGKKSNKILLVAHADTYFDQAYGYEKKEHRIVSGETEVSVDMGFGLGADDRAGCALLWLLRNSGHSLLITDGEEHGQKGSHFLKINYKSLYQHIGDSHQYIIQFDRKGSRNFKCYDVGTEVFKKYISDFSGYELKADSGFTDIGVLCDKICGVNLSIGYHNEHTQNEKIIFSEWLETHELVQKLISLKKVPKFRIC